MAAVKNILFSDLDLTFAKHPITGKLSVLQNNAAVAKSIRNLVLTNKMERPYQPLVGSDVYSRLFENMDNITAFNVKKDVKAVIENYEPRAELIDVRVDAGIDSNQLAVTIVFRVVNQLAPVETTVYIERIR